MKTTILSTLAVLSLASTTLAEPLAIGADAPKVSVKDQDGKEVKLEDVYKKGATLVYFYPKASTPGCTKQACALRDSIKDLEKLGLQVLGVSMDDETSQKKFHTEQNLTFSLLADTKGDVVKGFGVPEMKPGIPSRQSFLVKDGKVIWRDTEVKVDKHLENVKAEVAKLSAPDAK
jgi:thioredoxin-dependent peroxiredoxin